jgi:hypothetical protein
MKLLWIIFFSFSCIFVKSQNGMDTLMIPKNELKFNVLYLLLVNPEFTFERAISRHNSVGLSISQGLSSNDLALGYSFTPFTRLYFGERKRVNGLFFEGNCSLFEKTPLHLVNGGSYIARYLQMGVGMGVGYKYTLKQKTTFEVLCGLGRVLATDDPYKNNHLFYPRLGVTVGRKF